MLFFLFTGLISISWAACLTPVCDSFDSYTGRIVNSFGYGPNNLSASVAIRGSIMNASVDTSFSWSPPGSLSLKCSLAAPNQTNAVLNYNPAVVWPEVFGRAMVFYSNTSGARVPTDVHSWIFNAAGENEYFRTHNDTSKNLTAPVPGVSMNLIVGGPGGKIGLNYHWSGGEAGAWSAKNQTIEAEKWFCLQWHYDGPNSDAKVWVDGVLWVNVTHNDSWTGYTPINYNPTQWRFPDKTGWTKMQFGFTHYQTLGASVDLHLDDFVLDTQMTCCPCKAGDGGSHCCSNFVPPTISPTKVQVPSPAPTGNGTALDSSIGSSIVASVMIVVSLVMCL